MEILHHQRFVLPAGHILADSYDVVWCGACGFAYADTAADQATYDRYYAAFSKYEDNKTSAGGGGSDWDSRRLRETADDIAGVVSNREARVVDIGCANGGLLAELRSCGFGNLLGIACPMCFIPKLSYDYRLLMLIAPLCLFISANTPMTRQNIIICVVFGLLLIPKGQVILYFKPNLGPWGHGIVTPASLINPLLLLSLTMLVEYPSKKEETNPVEPLPAGVEPEMMGC